MTPIAIARFWLKAVERPGPLSTPCWVWTAGTDRKGYGVFGIGAIRHFAHRVAWTLIYGEPGALHVLHRCDNPPCVRPDHLFLGTQLDNLDDMARKGRFKRTIITTEMRNAILALLAEGQLSQHQIAAQFGISQTTVHRIKRLYLLPSN